MDPHFDTPTLDRRNLMGLTKVVAGTMAFTALADIPGVASAEAAASAAASEQKEVLVTMPEDLMREHGVLKRVLLVYRDVVRRIEHDEKIPQKELDTGARIIREFIHNHHEHLEEKYLFSRLFRDGLLVHTVTELRTQHTRGRAVTARILDITGSAKEPDKEIRKKLAEALTAFVRMYEPHEAREDTVVFPVYRNNVSPSTFARVSEICEDEEHRRFGPTGFVKFVDQVADVEKSLGIYELAQFTPQL